MSTCIFENLQYTYTYLGQEYEVFMHAYTVCTCKANLMHMASAFYTNIVLGI